MTTRTLEHLEALISMDTRNPPRSIQTDHDAILYTSSVLENAGFDVLIDDLGEGCLCIDAKRGESALVANCHLDTVPLTEGWSGDPFRMSVKGGRAYGLGACDVKGAMSCILAGAEDSEAPARVLFTTDEEAGQSRCVRHWTKENINEADCVLVCEPTNLRAVTAHRGLLTAVATFTQEAGHSSGVAIDRESAIADLVRWSSRLLSQRELVSDHLLNIGRVEGGTKPNMIADHAIARFGLRCRPGVNTDQLLEAIAMLAPNPDRSSVATCFHAPALQPNARSEAWAQRLGLDIAPPVDFWTEAALFASSGVPSFVYGPGDISQAHAPNEHVPVAQLESATAFFADVFNGVHAGEDVAHAAP